MVIFVSYNHQEDIRWFEKEYHNERPLVPWLEARLSKQGVELWYDRKGLGAGDAFRAEIERQIDRADIAILLVSGGFMRSEFIRDVEFPRIEDRAERGELVMIPIITRPCDWGALNLLERVIIMPSDAKTLIEYTESEVAYVKVTEQIACAIERQVGKLREEAKPRLLCGRAATALYGDPVGGVDVRIDPPGVVAQTDEHGSFTVELAREQYTDAGQSATFAVPGYRPLSAQLQFDEELVLSLTPDDWPECPKCGQANRPENCHCWQCGCALCEQTLASSADATQIACSECGSRYGADVCPTFCQQCGSRLKGEQAAPPLSPG